LPGCKAVSYQIRRRRKRTLIFFCVLISFLTFILFCSFPQSLLLVSFLTFILFLLSFLFSFLYSLCSFFIYCSYFLQLQVLHFLPFIQNFPFTFFFRRTLFIFPFPSLLHILYCIIVLFPSHICSMYQQALPSQKFMSANFGGLTRFQLLLNTKDLCMLRRLST
jgi:hypothetical protein